MRIFEFVIAPAVVIVATGLIGWSASEVYTAANDPTNAVHISRYVADLPKDEISDFLEEEKGTTSDTSVFEPYFTNLDIVRYEIQNDSDIVIKSFKAWVDGKSVYVVEKDGNTNTHAAVDGAIEVSLLPRTTMVLLVMSKGYTLSDTHRFTIGDKGIPVKELNSRYGRSSEDYGDLLSDIARHSPALLSFFLLVGVTGVLLLPISVVAEFMLPATYRAKQLDNYAAARSLALIEIAEAADANKGRSIRTKAHELRTKWTTRRSTP